MVRWINGMKLPIESFHFNCSMTLFSKVSEISRISFTFICIFSYVYALLFFTSSGLPWNFWIRRSPSNNLKNKCVTLFPLFTFKSSSFLYLHPKVYNFLHPKFKIRISYYCLFSIRLWYSMRYLYEFERRKVWSTSSSVGSSQWSIDYVRTVLFAEEHQEKGSSLENEWDIWNEVRHLLYSITSPLVNGSI